MDPDDLRAKLEAGRRATTGSLRSLADQIDALPMDDAAEVLVWLQDQLSALVREAGRILRRE